MMKHRTEIFLVLEVDDSIGGAPVSGGATADAADPGRTAVEMALDKIVDEVVVPRLSEALNGHGVVLSANTWTVISYDEDEGGTF